MKKIILGSLFVASFLFADAKVEDVLKIHENTLSALIDKKAEKSEVEQLKKKIEELEKSMNQKEPNKNYDSKYDEKFKQYLEERENSKK